MLGLGKGMARMTQSMPDAIVGKRLGFTNTKSLEFGGGEGDYVNTNYTANDLFRGSFSFSYWINLDSSYAIPIGIEKGTHSQIILQHFNGNVNIIHYSNSDLAVVTGAGLPVSTNTWHHVVWTFSKNSGSHTTYAMYVDNSAVPQAFLGGHTVSEANHNAFNSSGEFLAIGASNDDGTPDTFVDGHMDEVAIFNKALSSGEVEAIYNSGVPKDESSHDGLFMYYRFEDDVSDTAGTSNGTNNGATFSSTVPS
jgi:hypothetical protein